MPDRTTRSARALHAPPCPDGSGIGLFVVRTSVDHHGGVLHFGASPLECAEVLLALPPLTPQ